MTTNTSEIHEFIIPNKNKTEVLPYELAAFRINLHNILYTMENVNNFLIPYLKEYFSECSFEFNPITKRIIILFKKSYFNLRKESDYSHTSTFYSKYINLALWGFLRDFYSTIENCRTNNLYKIVYRYIMEISDRASLIYNIQAITGNTIIIDL